MNNFKSHDSLISFFSEYKESPNISFHMPGHKGGEIFRRFGYGELLEKLPLLDVTEIPGADNLFRPEDSILGIMKKYEAIYGSRASFLSVGGSSAGLMASIMTVIERGDGILVARNSHKSIYNGIDLAGGVPYYVYPEEGREISPESIERVLNEARAGSGPTIKAAVLPFPNYYGFISDINRISEICHKYGVVLIVDQAHGAHLGLSESGRFLSRGPEIIRGADISVCSTHKTLASFTQTAVVNVYSELVSESLLASNLEIIESSSPSYPMMLSLDINAEILKANGDNLLSEWSENLDYFYGAARSIEGLKVIESPMLDRSKLLLSMKEIGISGDELFSRLFEKGLTLELYDADLAMAMTGVGNVRSDYEALIAALEEISEESSSQLRGEARNPASCDDAESIDNHEIVDDAETADGLNDALSRWGYAIGAVAARNITPYPPGIPLVVKGEALDREILKKIYLLKAAGIKVMGLTKDGEIPVVSGNASLTNEGLE